MGKLSLFRVAETAATITDRVLVGFSGGKDSVATLDVCVRHFKHVEIYFQYVVKSLEFQESIIRYYEDKYGVKVHRVPHFMLSELLRYGSFRQPDFDVPIVSVKQTYDFLRSESGIWWIACGERIDDSVWRRAMIKQSGSIDEKRGRFYPLADWSKRDVLSYIRQRRLRVGLESSKLGFSFRSLMPSDMFKIKHNFPADYARIREWFPLIDASVRHHEFFSAQK